ncbi:MAG TPA: hypothetical protein VFV34_00150 [Blastocatellia bacterium]|nr:hypothetical protein [Blastocatellia bacterium]
MISGTRFRFGLFIRLISRLKRTPTRLTSNDVGRRSFHCPLHPMFNEFLRSSILLMTIALASNAALAQNQAEPAATAPAGHFEFRIGGAVTAITSRQTRHARLNLAPSSFVAPAASAPNLPVFGVGTVGKLTKWSGFTGSNAVVADSNIYEEKSGKVGIGTTTPTSLLTVQGMIETFGGIRFPDGTTQTSSAQGSLLTVSHNPTLAGDGTVLSPLGIGLPLLLSGVANFSPLVLVANNGAGDGVRVVVLQTTALAGVSSTGTGVTGEGFIGVRGVSSTDIGVEGESTNSTPQGAGVLGIGADSAGGANAGRFFGNVSVEPSLAQTGNLSVFGLLSKGAGSFKIDHPLDPENKYLYHSFVESPDMKNIYDGNVITDDNGEAVVQLPDWFEALNKDFRYQLTVIGAFAQAIVADKIKGNRFVIKTSTPNVEVSWQVTGIRRDAFANLHRIPVEEEKPEFERGHYLHPDAFNQPPEKSIQWARDPERMQRLKRRAQADGKFPPHNANQK